ncbi:MAG: hypothetical protein HDT21_05875 [Ruminococcus sp.]|nr:hypothetical protein [Ruminococcus sp.]
MKKYLLLILAALMAAAMLTACGNKNNADDVENESAATLSETENAVAETITEQATEMTSEENVETYAVTEEVTETEAIAENNSITILSEDELSSDAKKFFKAINSYRKKENVEAVIPVKELNECAKKYVGEISDNFFVFSDGTRADGSEFSSLLDEAEISYTVCDKIYNYIMSYNIDSIIVNIPYSKSSYEIATLPKWKYMGFYADESKGYWVAIFISDDPADAPMPETDTYYDYSDSDDVQSVSSYYDDTSEFSALNTYMNALCNDDYSTYLAITRQDDSSDAAEDFEESKKGYVGMSASDIKCYEVGEGFGLGGYGVYYNVVEYDSNGSAKLDINTFGDACGTVVVSGSNKSYYIATHHRYSPYVTIDKLAN